MELNKVYLQSDIPIKNLIEGTIIEVYFEDCLSEWNKDLLVITTNDANFHSNYIEAVSILNGGFYVECHTIQKYIIKSFPNRKPQEEFDD